MVLAPPNDPWAGLRARTGGAEVEGPYVPFQSPCHGQWCLSSCRYATPSSPHHHPTPISVLHHILPTSHPSSLPLLRPKLHPHLPSELVPCHMGSFCFILHRLESTILFPGHFSVAPSAGKEPPRPACSGTHARRQSCLTSCPHPSHTNLLSTHIFSHRGPSWPGKGLCVLPMAAQWCFFKDASPGPPARPRPLEPLVTAPTPLPPALLPFAVVAPAL